jgi:hypothetical protein
MKLKHIFNLTLLFVVFLAGCKNCEKLNLTQSEKDWVNHFKPGQSFYYKSLAGRIDTLETRDTSNYYTPCNKAELAKYQYEIYFVQFKIRSSNSYNGDEPSIRVTTQEWLIKSPYIYFGDLGPHRNDLDNKIPVPIDTVLNDVHLKSVYYYAKDLNTEQYGQKDYFKNFFWDKQSGLVAYTTVNNEKFLRINQ